MFLEQIGSLEKEKAALSLELEEKKEMDEFKSLEEEFRKEHEVKLSSIQIPQWTEEICDIIRCFHLACVILQNELQDEITSLQKVGESSELQRRQLQVS